MTRLDYICPLAADTTSGLPLLLPEPVRPPADTAPQELRFSVQEQPTYISVPVDIENEPGCDITSLAAGTNYNSTDIAATWQFCVSAMDAANADVNWIASDRTSMQSWFVNHGYLSRRIAPPTNALLAHRILNDAIVRYRQLDGYEGHLVDAADRLELLGPDAWQALKILVLAELPECEFFLGAVVRLKRIMDQDRLAILLAAARIPDGNTRSRLLELLEEMPPEMASAVMRELRAEERPNDRVTRRAREAESQPNP